MSEQRLVASSFVVGDGLSLIDLTGNAFGDAGASALAETLRNAARSRHSLQLQTLRLDRCAIGDVGATALASALGRMPDMRELSLRKNKIGDAGVVALAENMPAGVRALLVNANAFGEEGLEALRGLQRGRKDTLVDLGVDKRSDLTEYLMQAQFFPVRPAFYY